MFLSLNRCRAAVKSGPPFVLFTISIVILGLSAFSLALIIQNSKEPFPNPDAINWDSLLRRLSKLDLCIRKSNDSIQEKPGVSLLFPSLFPVNINGGELSDSLSVIQGSFPLSELPSVNGGIKATYPSQALLEITLRLSPKKELTCITVHEPSQLLRDLQRIPITKGNCDASSQNASGLYTFTAQSFSCPQISMKLPYLPRPNWRLSLSDGDRQRIYAHLMVTSGVLLACSALIILYVCARGVGSRDNYKFSGRRGDMELLRSDSPLE